MQNNCTDFQTRIGMGDMLWGVEEEKSVGGYWLILKGPKSKRSITMKNKTNHSYLHLLLTWTTGVSSEQEDCGGGRCWMLRL